MTRLPVILLVFAGLVLVAIGWLVTASDPSAPDAILREREREILAAAADDAPLGVSDTVLRGDEEGDMVREEAGDDPQPDAERGTSRGGTLRVVDRDGAAVVGASIRWVTRDRMRALRRDVLHPADAVDLHGIDAGTTDALGRVPLPAFEDRLYLAAALGDSYGYRELRTNHEPEVVMRLAEDSHVALTVVDGGGAGIEDVPIVLEQARNRSWRRLLRASSQPEGRILLSHLQLHARAFRNGDRNGFRVQFAFPHTQTGLLEFNLPHRGETTLVMPPVAPLRIAVRGPQDMPFATRATVRIEAEATPDGVDAEQSLTLAPWTGEVEFPFVEIGLKFRVSVRPRDRDLAWNVPSLMGPTVAAQPTTLRIDTPPWMAIVAGQLLRSDAPLADSEVDLLLTGGRGRIEGERVGTSPKGLFELPVRVADNTIGPFALQAVRTRGRRDTDDTPWGARTALQGLAGQRRIDVGEFRLDALPAFVTGIAVDDRGEPVRNARIQLLRLRGDDQDGRWAQDQGSAARTGEDGTFALYADPAPGRVLIEATARNHRRDRSAELGPGAAVRLVLTRTATLRGRGLVPRWLPQNALELVITDSRGERVWNRLTVRGERLDFRTGELDPGDFRMVLLLRGFPDPIADLGSIWVEPGAQSMDLPDLRNAVYRYRLQAIRSDGQPMRDPRAPLVARVTRMDGTQEIVGFPWNGRRLELFSASPTVQATALGMGYRPQKLLLTPGDSTITFQALQPVELTVDGARRLAGPGQRVRVSMVYTGETNLPSGLRARDQNSGDRRNYSRAQLSKSGGAWLPEDGDTVAMPLNLDGEYAVVLRFHGKGRPVSRRIGTVSVQLSTLRPARARLPADADAIREALAELATR